MSGYEIIGLLGVAIVLVAYFMLASRRWTSNDMPYPVTNIIGTCLILYSLTFDMNIPSIVAQIVWIGISVAAVLRIRAKKAP